MPSVHVVLVGINRSLSFTASSIEREVITPLTSSRLFTPQFSAALITPPQGVIDNPRSGEEGDIQWVIPEPIASWPTLRLDMTHVVKNTDTTPVDDGVLSDDWDDDGQSYLNLRTFLHALHLAYTAYLEDQPPDFVIMVRPDLSIEGRLWVRTRLLIMMVLRRINPNVAVLPAWGRHRGLNDRFAILTTPAAAEYFTRDANADQYFAEGHQLTSEKFLAHTLRDTLVWNGIYTAMRRVRLGGVTDEADDGLVERSALYRRRQKLRTSVTTLFRRVRRSIGA